MAEKKLKYTAEQIDSAIEKVKNMPSEGVIGPKGEQGATGPAGKDGKEIELQKTSTYIQWRYVGGSWNNLVALADLKGDKGDGANVDLTDYALKSWVTEQIARVQAGGSVDLSSYYNKTEIDMKLSSKADSTTVTSHTSDTTSHITSAERISWNSKSTLALGTSSSTAFRGDYGNVAYTHSQSAHAPYNAEANVQADWNVSDASSDAYIKNKPVIPVAYDDSEIRSSLDNIMKDFNEHITNHPSGDIDNIINSLEPSTNDIPKVYFTGDISGMNKDVEKILTFSYKSNTKKINGFVKMKWQGTSSLAYPKKNFTIKMFKDEGCLTKDKHTFKNWEYETNKYVLKANYIDHSHARNIVSARLWNDVVKSREDYSLLPTEYQSMPNGGGVDGFPIKLYINGVYQGLYTWNIGKEGWTYGMKSEKDTYAVLCGENYVSGCFRATAMINGTDWSLEYPDTLQNSIKTSWNSAISFVMDNSGNTFKNGLSTYFDVNSLIDYYIFAYFSCGLDSMGKNQIYTTYNGTKWYAHMYDMDSTWGLYWDGKKFVSSSYRCQEDYESMISDRVGNLLYIKLVENFGKEIYERYSELRKTVLSIDNVIDRFERFTDVIPNDLYKEDISVYNGIPSSNTNNIQQIRKYIVERANYVDGRIAELNSTPIPITGLTLDKSNTTVNVGSNEILTVSYTPTNTNQKGVIWTSSDTSKATVSDGVVNGVSEGDCVITATSLYNSSLKAICNVNIQEENEENKPVYKLPSETVFNSTNKDYIDTGIKLFDINKSFTVFVDFTPNSTGAFNGTVLHCMKEVSPWYGMSLDFVAENTKNYRVAIVNKSIQLFDNQGNNIPYSSNINQKYIIVKEAGNNDLKVYNYNYRQVQSITVPILQDAITDVNLYVGAMNKNGTIDRYWNGTVHKLKVWFRVLEINEINKEFGENIF